MTKLFPVITITFGLKNSLVQRYKRRVQLYSLIAVDRNRRSALRSTCSTWMSD